MEVRNIPLPGGDALWVRLFLPPPPPPPHSSSLASSATDDGVVQQQEQLQNHEDRMPVVLYAHGGAYCWGQPDWDVFHRFCATMALLSRSIWISLAYRLAPAHRLPAQFEDGFAAFMWLRAHARYAFHRPSELVDGDQQRVGGGKEEAEIDDDSIQIDQGLARAGDFSRVFLAGESAGATIMLSVTMRVADMDVSPLQIRGLILIHPGFHTEAKRARMEKGDNGDGDGPQPPFSLLQMYEAALPQGEDLDYPGINPLSPRAPSLTPLRSCCPNIFLSVADADLRRDLSLRFYQALLHQRICPSVDFLLTPLKDHVFHLRDPDCPEAVHMHARIAQFLHRLSTDRHGLP